MSAASAALAPLCTFSDPFELNQLVKMIRLTTDLAGLVLETIESKFLIGPRDLVDKDATGFSATDGQTTCSHCGRTNHSSDMCFKKHPLLMPK
jgi:hypothetical protein